MALTNALKREVFMKWRSENYRASLRLEGLLEQAPAPKKQQAKPVLTVVPAKRVR